MSRKAASGSSSRIARERLDAVSRRRAGASPRARAPPGGRAGTRRARARRRRPGSSARRRSWGGQGKLDRDDRALRARSRGSRGGPRSPCARRRRSRMLASPTPPAVAVGEAHAGVGDLEDERSALAARAQLDARRPRPSARGRAGSRSPRPAAAASAGSRSPRGPRAGRSRPAAARPCAPASTSRKSAMSANSSASVVELRARGGERGAQEADEASPACASRAPGRVDEARHVGERVEEEVRLDLRLQRAQVGERWPRARCRRCGAARAPARPRRAALFSRQKYMIADHDRDHEARERDGEDPAVVAQLAEEVPADQLRREPEAGDHADGAHRRVVEGDDDPPGLQDRALDGARGPGRRAGAACSRRSSRRRS